jgi:cytochrome P450
MGGGSAGGELLTTGTDVDDATDYNDPNITGYWQRLAPLREELGVARLRFGATAGWVLLRYADVSTAFRDDTRFSKGAALKPITFPMMGPNIQGYDGHEHTVHRGLVSPAFRRTAIPRYVEPLLRPTAEELVAEIAPLGEADLMATFAKRYPLRVITELLGIPRQDEDRMAAWAKAMLNAVVDPAGTSRANAEFTDYVTPLVEQRRTHPGDDLLSAIVNEEVEGHRLDDDHVFGFLRLLFPAGVDTTWLALGSLMTAVLQQPVEIRDRLVESESERAWAIEETVRWEGTTGTEPRLTMEDVVLCGRKIRAGELLRLAVPSANHDPRVFDDPDRWDLDRRPTNHLAFGLGRHFCLGAFLARSEMNVALEVLLSRLPNLGLVEVPEIYGVVLRGPRSVPVRWDAP